MIKILSKLILLALCLLAKVSQAQEQAEALLEEYANTVEVEAFKKNLIKVYQWQSAHESRSEIFNSIRLLNFTDSIEFVVRLERDRAITSADGAIIREFLVSRMRMEERALTMRLITREQLAGEYASTPMGILYGQWMLDAYYANNKYTTKLTSRAITYDIVTYSFSYDGFMLNRWIRTTESNLLAKSKNFQSEWKNIKYLYYPRSGATIHINVTTPISREAYFKSLEKKLPLEEYRELLYANARHARLEAKLIPIRQGIVTLSDRIKFGAGAAIGIAASAVIKPCQMISEWWEYHRTLFGTR